MTISLTTLGIFIDGNYFKKASNYYLFEHKQKKRLSTEGLVNFAKEYVAQLQGGDTSLVSAETHLYIGKLDTQTAIQRNILEKERLFEESLSKKGIETHTAPLVFGAEKGIDVMYALDVYSGAIEKKFDIAVLVTADGDFAPLVERLKRKRMPVLLLCWRIKKHQDNFGNDYELCVSKLLSDNATWCVYMDEVCDGEIDKYKHLISSLFIQGKQNFESFEDQESIGQTLTGKVVSTKTTFGFISIDDTNSSIFFHFSDLSKPVSEGDKVRFLVGQNENGPCARNIEIINQKEECLESI